MIIPPNNPTLQYTIKLFITGRTAKSDLAIANIRRIFTRMNFLLDLTIIDILETPQAAEEYRIIATPTLIKISPLPVQRIIGDLSDEGKVYFGLGIAPIESVHRSSHE